MINQTRCPYRKPFREEPIFDKPKEANNWHNQLYNFENAFDTPLNTPRDEERIFMTMH